MYIFSRYIKTVALFAVLFILFGCAYGARVQGYYDQVAKSEKPSELLYSTVKCLEDGRVSESDKIKLLLVTGGRAIIILQRYALAIRNGESVDTKEIADIVEIVDAISAKYDALDPELKVKVENAAFDFLKSVLEQTLSKDSSVLDDLKSLLQ